MNNYLNFALLVFLSTCLSCSNRSKLGILKISAPAHGTYEIYKISTNVKLELEAEVLGHFGEEVFLSPGTYLVLSDCSSKNVVIHPEERQELFVDQVRFLFPIPDPGNQKFEVQCSRDERTFVRQSLINQYSLFIFPGEKKILVGLTPVRVGRTSKGNSIDQKELSSELEVFKEITPSSPVENKQVPTTIDYNLAAIKINKPVNTEGEGQYFVTSPDSSVSTTLAQTIGSAILLLPGRYTVQLNGTKHDLTLSAGEVADLTPGTLKVSTPSDLDATRSANIRGTPLFVELNNGRWLDLNETYPVLSGQHRLRLGGGENDLKVAIEENQNVDIKTYAVRVDLDCPIWVWTCFGSKRVFLSEGKEITAQIASGITDVPTLYFNPNTLVSIEGSRDLHYRIPDMNSLAILKTGTLRLIPKIKKNEYQYTDLMRLEALQEGFTGRTLDLDLQNSSELTLIAGKYTLARYVSSSNSDVDRKRVEDVVHICENCIIEKEVSINLLPKQSERYVKLQQKKNHVNQKTFRQRYTKNYHNAQPKPVF